jgi:hypothetical protein
MRKKGRHYQDDKLVATVEYNGRKWSVYEKDDPENQTDWKGYKLAIVGSCRKANYHLSHNGERFARNKEVQHLLEVRPGLYDMVNSAIINHVSIRQPKIRDTQQDGG